MRGKRVAKAMLQESWLTASGEARKHLARGGKPRGGRRPGAGRPPNGERAGGPHARRPVVKASTPVQVTLRVAKAVSNLRRRDMYRALRASTLVAAKHEDMRIVHISIQHNHVHLLVEADSKAALARGMKAFQVSAAKRINRLLPLVDGKRRRGAVFPDRYHLEVITSRRQARNALAYVLNNWRKHGEHRSKAMRGFRVDPFSTAVLFRDWKGGALAWTLPPTYEPLVVWPARSWLLTEGWRMYGLIGVTELPSRTVARARMDRAFHRRMRAATAFS